MVIRHVIEGRGQVRDGLEQGCARPGACGGMGLPADMKWLRQTHGGVTLWAAFILMHEDEKKCYLATPQREGEFGLGRTETPGGAGRGRCG